MNTVPDRVVRFREAAERLSVSVRHLYKLAAQGRIRTASLGVRRLGIPESVLSKIISGEAGS